MKPILYYHSETQFENNGIGVLSDAISCVVTEERNGEFELELQYPINGIHFSSIYPRNLVLAKVPNKQDGTENLQPFRIYTVSKAVNGVCTFKARHISYDLGGHIVKAFSAQSLTSAVNELNTYSTATGYTLSTDKTFAKASEFPNPAHYRTMIGTLLSFYGGELEWDMFDVILHDERGQDNGMKFAYGMNIIDLSDEESVADVYTGVQAYWKKEDTFVYGNVVSTGSFDYTKNFPLDASSSFEEQPTTEELDAVARAYISDMGLSARNSHNITLSYADLSKAGYENVNSEIHLCDTVTVEYPKLNVSYEEKIIKYTYDVLLERVTSIEIGNPKEKLSDVIKDLKKTTDAVVTAIEDGDIGGGGGGEPSINIVSVSEVPASPEPNTLYLIRYYQEQSGGGTE